MAPGPTSDEVTNPLMGPYMCLVPEMSSLCSSFVPVAFTLSGLLVDTLSLLHEDKESGSTLMIIQLWEDKGFLLSRSQPLRLPRVFPSRGGCFWSREILLSLA